MWVTIPVEKALVEKWLDAVFADKETDRQFVVLDPVVPGYNSTYHPVQIEWDSFHSCKSVGGIPYPDFNEVATMIPYVRWQNSSGTSESRVHFQPWTIVNNIFGRAAMTLTGSRNVEQATGGAQYPTPPASWAQWTTADSSVLSLRDAHVENLEDSASLASKDAAWREMLNLKHTKSITYDKCLLHGNDWTYSCNTIKWDVLKAVKLNAGQLDTTQGSSQAPPFFPVSIKGDIAKLQEQFPGLQAYATQNTMSAVIGCSSDTTDSAILV